MSHPKQQVRELAMGFACINGTAGDYLEFGVYRGHGLLTAVNAHAEIVGIVSRETLRPGLAARFEEFQRMRFFGFDSFQGLSAPTSEDQDWLQAGDLACGRNEVERNMPSNVSLVGGFFSDSLKPELRQDLQLSKAAIIYLDCDLYEPSWQALQWCTPLVQDSTVVVLDDYFLFGGHPKRGQRRAWEEWVYANGFEVTELFRHGPVAFVVHL